MKSPDVFIYDTTLRDGTQGEQINFSAEEKLRIARRLDDMGFHYIEGGWPGSNPKDVRFFEMAKGHAFRHARLTAFGSTRQAGHPARKLPEHQGPAQGRRRRPSPSSERAGTSTSRRSSGSPWRKTWR